MNEQTIWNINYNANAIEFAIATADPLIAKITSPNSTREELTAEETWQLREALRSIDSHNRMTRQDLHFAAERQIATRIKKLFRRK